ncbi:MAG: hypothetical protein P8X43_15430 [Maritimibacter sp.]
MTATFRILPARSLVYCRYEGVITLPVAEKLYNDYIQHPDYRPGQLHLVDLSAASGWSAEFMQFMRLQAKNAGALGLEAGEVLMVYLAPTPMAHEIAETIRRTWAAIEGAVPIIVEREDEALVVLGQPEASIEELLSTAPVAQQPRQVLA